MDFLVVDDSKAMRMIVKRTLRQAGYGDANVKEATNGKEALDLLGGWTPDLVLCDWNMPEMTGIDLLKELRNQGNEVKFGFVTSEGTPEMRQMATESGALFLIHKPFTPDTFKKQLEGVV